MQAAEILELYRAILAVVALQLVSALFTWYRIGKLRDLLKGAQGVHLAAELKELHDVVKQQGQRITRLEEERSSWRGEAIEVNQQLLRAMDGLRTEWRNQLSEIAQRVAAEVRVLIDADVRRLVRDEYHKLARVAGSNGDEA